MGRFDKEKRQFIEAPHSIGIEIRRQLDHLSCYYERLYLEFQSQEKLTHLEAYWHKLKPSESLPVASTNQIANWIKEGRARVQSLTIAGQGSRRIHPADISGISIAEIVLFYTGATYHKRHGFEEKSSKYLYPYALLTAEAELGPEDKEIIFLFVPVTANALTSISRTQDKYGFGIYPSRRYGQKQ